MQQKTNVCGILSLTLGIIALLLTCFSISWIIAIPGTVLGIIGMFLPGYKKGIAIAGFITNIAAITIFVGLYAILYSLNDALENAGF